jgi:hypothetical protein
MAFVKVVGGFEIYNFRIQHLVHFYTRFWSFSIFNRVPAARLGSNAVAPRRRARPRAGRPRRLCHAPPDAPPPEVARHPRPTRLPQAGAVPRDVSVCPCHAPPHRCAVRVPCTRRTAGPSAVRPYARRPRSAIARRHHGRRHPAVTAGRAPLYLRRPPSPRARTATPSRRHARRLGELLAASSTNLPSHLLQLFVFLCNLIMQDQ